MSKKTNFTHYEKWFAGKNAPRDLVRWLQKHPDFKGNIEVDYWDTFCGQEQIDDWHIHITSKEERADAGDTCTTFGGVVTTGTTR